ncbi:hypothetical protein HDU88_002116 [Geranomyces variabilis]|nr:hypothetical protein HDU88_002116 [Geranomyces variabilis]
MASCPHTHPVLAILLALIPATFAVPQQLPQLLQRQQQRHHQQLQQRAEPPVPPLPSPTATILDNGSAYNSGFTAATGPAGQDNSSHSSLTTEFLVIPIAIFIGIVVIALALRMSTRLRRCFSKTPVTSSKPVEIVYSNVQHEDLVVPVPPTQRALREPSRDLRRVATFESLATVYMDTPPSYAQNALLLPMSRR